QQRLVHLRIERLALRVHTVQPLGAERVQELRVHELDPVQEPLVVGLLGRVDQRELEVVEHLEQPAHHRFRRHVDGGGLLAQHALAVVVELRRETLQVREVLLLLRATRRLVVGSLDGVGPAGGGRLRALRLREPREPSLVGDLDHRRIVVAVLGHGPPPSSTISPSTTSSSPEASSPPEGASASPPSAGADVACVFWYIAWPIRLNTVITASLAAVSVAASAASSFRASFSASLTFVSSSRSDAGTLSPHSPSDLSTV